MDSKSLFAMAKYMWILELTIKRQKPLVEFTKRVDKDGTGVEMLTKLLNSEHINDTEIDEFIELTSKKVGYSLDKEKVKGKIIELRKQRNTRCHNNA